MFKKVKLESIANIMLNSKMRNKTRMSTLTTVIQFHWNAQIVNKERKGIQIGKEDIKFSPFVNNNLHRKSQESTKQKQRPKTKQNKTSQN